jgi:hypothetical protein
MGYKRKKTIYRLVFEDEEFDGLEVRAYAPPLSYLKRSIDMAALAGRRSDELSPDELALVNGFFTGFSKHLVSWNLEDDDGAPVPATLEGVLDQDIDFVFQIIGAWLDSVGEVAGPLGQSSSAGLPSLAASLPMEPLSPSQQNLSGPSLSSAAVSGSDAFRAS